MCLSEFSNIGTVGGLYQFAVERKEQDQGGSYEVSIRFTRLGVSKRIRLQIADSSVDHCQDRDPRMGFHIGIFIYVFGIPLSLFWGPT